MDRTFYDIVIDAERNGVISWGERNKLIRDCLALPSDPVEQNDTLGLASKTEESATDLPFDESEPCLGFDRMQLEQSRLSHPYEKLTAFLLNLPATSVLSGSEFQACLRLLLTLSDRNRSLLISFLSQLNEQDILRSMQQRKESA